MAATTNPILRGSLSHGSEQHLTAVDLATLRAYRYARVQEQLRAHQCAAALLYNPINIRYATDSRNMTVWMLHNMGRYCVVPAEGKAVLFEYANQNCLLLAGQLPAIGEVRPALIHAFFDVAEHAVPVSRRWAAEIHDLVRGLMDQGATGWPWIAPTSTGSMRYAPRTGSSWKASGCSSSPDQ